MFSFLTGNEKIVSGFIFTFIEHLIFTFIVINLIRTDKQ